MSNKVDDDNLDAVCEAPGNVSTIDKVDKPSTDGDASVNAIIVPFAPFREGNPKAWFAQLESTFALRKISSQFTRYHYVVAALPSVVLEEVEDILGSPDSDKPYDHLKEAVIKRVGLSDRQRIAQLLSETELGDRKPSQLLRTMQRLAGNTQLEEAFLKEMWLQRLPRDMQNILSANPLATLAQSADTADRIWETYGKQVFQVTTQSQDALSVLSERVTDLTQQFHVFSMSLPRSRSRSRSLPRSRPRESHVPMANVDPNHCWYHQRFGVRARTCRSPCSFTKKNQGN